MHCGPTFAVFGWRVNIKGAFFYPHTQRVNFTLCFFYADCLHSIKIHVPLQPANEEAVCSLKKELVRGFEGFTGYKRDMR